MRNLGEYLTIGGFLATDSKEYFSERQMFEDAFATKDLREGRHWAYVTLENDHPLFHAFYDLEGPPLEAFGIQTQYNNEPWVPTQLTGLNTETLRESNKSQGVEYAGRLVGVLQVNVRKWARYAFEHHTRGGGIPADNRNDLKYGVNLVIFALTQEGSLAERFVKAGR